MGQGCTLRTNIYFRDKMYKNKYQLDEDIELQERIIKNAENELMQLIVMTEPAKFWRESEADIGETPWIWMQNQAMDAIEAIKEAQMELAKLYRLQDEWDECHTKDGIAIDSPKTDTNKSYFWGDFLDSVYPDGTVSFSMKKYREELGIK